MTNNAEILETRLPLDCDLLTWAIVFQQLASALRLEAIALAVGAPRRLERARQRAIAVGLMRTLGAALVEQEVFTPAERDRLYALAGMDDTIDLVLNDPCADCGSTACSVYDPATGTIRCAVTGRAQLQLLAPPERLM